MRVLSVRRGLRYHDTLANKQRVCSGRLDVQLMPISPSLSAPQTAQAHPHTKHKGVCKTKRGSRCALPYLRVCMYHSLDVVVDMT